MSGINPQDNDDTSFANLGRPSDINEEKIKCEIQKSGEEIFMPSNNTTFDNNLSYAKDLPTPNEVRKV